ncbi:MAG: 3-phosphoshikimate 1-carboxyvinyltransferase [Solirubrobacterales bacterium]
MRRRFEPSGPLRGELSVPGDKSISHRAALLGAMGNGATDVTGYLDAADTVSTLEAVRALGARVDGAPPNLTIHGVGLRGAGSARIDVGNAGTLMRLLPGWLAGQPGGSWTLDGDASIRRRPVDRIADPLALMGARLEHADGRPPLTVHGSPLQGIEYAMPVASAQVKSCLLLAGLMADGETRVVEEIPSRDHTERMLAACGVELQVTDGADGHTVAATGGQAVEPPPLEVPGDLSSAAFWLCAAALVPGSAVCVRDVGVNPGRTGILDVLGRMGAQVTVSEPRTVAGEPRADVEVAHASLQGTTVPADEVPAVIDELPLVALLGALADGTTEVRGAEELRVKESDRITAVVEGLRGLGADCEARDDGFVIAGGAQLAGGTLTTGGDHRLAMLGAIAGLASRDGVVVEGMEAASVSYPDFERDLGRLAHARVNG